MVGNCSLESDINKCPYFIRDKEGCNNEDKVCCFYSDMESKAESPEVRKEKWFEKYYK